MIMTIKRRTTESGPPSPFVCLITTVCIRMFCVPPHVGAAAALSISEKQRARLREQAMAMSQYCALMCDRAKTMLNFMENECPDDCGNVLTLFRQKYPNFGLRAITMTVINKIGNGVCMHCVHTHILTQPSPPAYRYQGSRYIHTMAQTLYVVWQFSA